MTLKTNTSFILSPPLWGLFLALLLSGKANAQDSEFPFYPGEYVAYELSYNWGLLWVNAGMATFSVEDTVVQGERYFHFKGYGRSYDHWDWFYEVRSGYESFADENLHSQRFIRKGKEGSTTYDRDYHVKADSILYRITDGKENSEYGSLPLREEAVDVVTAIYQCRNIDFDQYQKGDSIPLTFYLAGNYYDSYLRYQGRQQWENPRTDEVHDCLVFSPYLIEGTIFKEGENMTVYVTDDRRKIPVYIETKLSVGKAKVFMLSHN